MKRLIPLLLAAVLALWVGMGLKTPKLERESAFHLDEFSRLPVLSNGRIKPLDTIARTHLLSFQGRQRVKNAEGETIAPTAWLLDMFFRPELADSYQTIEIVHPGVLDVVGLSINDGQDKKRFSFSQLESALPEIDRQAKLADALQSAQRDAFQRAIVQLRNRLVSYQQLKFTFTPGDGSDFRTDLVWLQDNVGPAVAAIRARFNNEEHDEALATRAMNLGSAFGHMNDMAGILPIPPQGDDTSDHLWQKSGQALVSTFQTGQVHPFALVYAGLGTAWQDQDPETFNTIITLYRGILDDSFAEQLKKADRENTFNGAEPFYRASVLFVIAMLLAIGSWLVWPKVLRPSAEAVLAVAWFVTTVGILTRMWLEGRPPVTNLYSSALFVGWGAVALCIILERLFPQAIAVTAGSLIGFATLLIAHHLSLSGDTLEMMRAVLDSNFWLATHVIVITIGYSATYLAGALAIIYIVRSRVPGGLDKNTGDALNRMVYGIVCFATLFSLIGTILGGIWADQSWGRFWGWDPKENGALIIVIWNAIILHARWGGMARTRGIMALAVFGNIVTSWSWFGTNMLGVGLHSYGFMDAAFWALIGFVTSQLILIGIAYLPTSAAKPTAPHLSASLDSAKGSNS
ncbi:cytochrome c biogenesis protein [Actomonas aquatica]|uniref:Cytochrome c biogenesis protein CcsA n=1 Tax=Actomonas aquatica TaxID=2866162 RepID=A0ABZ1CCB9_9BACT|nr:cytochrome c biogenesis protein CcsA [Opitutus sp. WL0086]WRQ89086.1 cytochrome c biogenesis protein CcsA [Opitutus sp. WL0086]